MSKEEISKHLEFIQGAINRMAANSFLLKGWTITLVAALFALAAKDSNTNYVVIAILPAASFWGLDAYYLRQERLFRALYNYIRLSSDKDAAKLDPFSLDTSPFKKQEKSWLRTLVAPTIISIHGIVMLALIVVYMYLK